MKSATQPKCKVFFDSSALFAGVFSATGGARLIMKLAEGKHLRLIVSQQVLAETERSLRAKAPDVLGRYALLLREINVEVVPDPAPEELTPYITLLPHREDVPILVAALKAKADYLVTLNRKHFLEVPGLAEKVGLPMGTPGDFITWYREHWLKARVER